MVDIQNKSENRSEIRSIPEILSLKLNGKELTPDDISFIVETITENMMEDSQLGTFLAAIFVKGMSESETAALTKAMRESGHVFQWPSDWKVVDKHSTGGVGDKVSLVLTPALASLGLKVPMISGRGLGHTGGTLDKLESIPGYRIAFNVKEIHNALETVGCCIVGQTKSLVPADKRMYSIRDITSTVASTPLVVSSIVSKKACESLQSLVLDVKYGSGSFTKYQDAAELLARALVNAGNALGINTTALVTNNSAPLGKKIGNTLEVDETLQCLRGDGPSDLEALVVHLGGELVQSSGLSKTIDEGKDMIRKSLYDCSAMNKFAEMLTFQDVSQEVVEDLCTKDAKAKSLPRSKSITNVFADESGTILDMNALAIAQVCLHLGGGRLKATDEINHAVGMVLLKVVGDDIKAGEPWAEIHHDSLLAEHLLLRTQKSITISKCDQPLVKPLLIAKRIV